VHWQREEG